MVQHEIYMAMDESYCDSPEGERERERCAVVDDAQLSDFDHQIAGHTTDKLRRYQHQYVLKPQNKVDLFRREVQFYEDIFGDPLTHAQQISFLAQYHGVSFIDTGRPTLLPTLTLDDLTLGYARPCVIDIKMGRQSFEPSATREKKEREIRKYPHQSEVGFRITGVKVWDETLGDYHYRNKAFGRSVLPERAAHAMACCFFNGRSLRIDVVKNLLLRFEALLAFMRVQRRYKFYCTSILVVYDAVVRGSVTGNGSNDSNENSDSTESTESSTHSEPRCSELFGRSYCADESDLSRSAMIDFARAVRSEEPDADYVYGLESLIAKLRAVVDVVERGDEAQLQDFLSVMHSIFVA